ncbi:MAG: spermidine/putrescine transporter ATPase subunit [Acidimicrobiia bacterium]|jgi:putative spermidine/putrescine transport system ATP-binding protein|nr:spermidine/putrescine transporter ATPase subunit [Acidimicrobiia bacterium]
MSGFLSLQGVRKEFNGVVAVESFNLEVEPGEFVSFLGPSGCGKTTTLRMVAGFEPPTSGTIRLAGEDVTYTKPNERNIGMVFQSYALFPNMTVAENIAFGLRVRKEEGAARSERVAELLDLIHLPDKAKAYPNELSGGQQQRVALARALAIRPQLLLLDEPLSALDAKIRDDLRAEIRRIQRQLNITTIYVTHDQEEALALSDRVVVMSKGRMEQVGEPFEIYNNPATGFVASFVGQLNRLPVTVVDPALGRLRAGRSEIRTTSLIESPEGAEVSLMMRPEEVTLDAEEDNVLEGTVESVTFLGSIVRVQVAVDGGRLTADLFNERLLELPVAGDATQVSFPSHACWVLA